MPYPHPTIGREIQVCIGIENQPVHRPAIIVRVWSNDCVNAQVFLDGANDDRHVVGKLFGVVDGFAQRGNTPAWATSIVAGDGVGQWRWPVVTQAWPPRATTGPVGPHDGAPSASEASECGGSTPPMDPLSAALTLAAAIVGHLPQPDPVIRRARYVQRLTALVARLEAKPRLTPMQRGRLEGAREALRVLREAGRPD